MGYLDHFSLDELREVAKLVRLDNFHQLNRISLIAQLQRQEPGKIKKALSKMWWFKYSNHIYGFSGVIGVLIAIITLIPRQSRENIGDYFKDTKPLGSFNIDLTRNSKYGDFDSPLKDQNDSYVNLWDDIYQYKLIAVTYRESPCKGVLETMNIVKKELSPYLSIQAYGIFLDSAANSSEISTFLKSNGLDLIGLRGTSKEISRLTDPLYYATTKLGKGRYGYAPAMILMRGKKMNHISKFNATAQEIAVTILTDFEQQKNSNNVQTASIIPILNEKPILGEHLKTIAQNIRQKDKARRFPSDCQH